MPWGKPKPQGAYLAVYGQGLERLRREGYTGWIELAVYTSETQAKRFTVEGRVWAQAATPEGMHLSFRARPYPHGWSLQMRLRPAAAIPDISKIL